MRSWPKHPVIYEINTWVWLGELAQKYLRPMSLATVPEQEWDAIASQGFDAVWFMGVWERSPAGIEISARNKGLLEDFRRALPGFSPEHNVGSPYCVRRYVVDEHLGGPKGLAAARSMLRKRGLWLILPQQVGQRQLDILAPPGIAQVALHEFAQALSRVYFGCSCFELRRFAFALSTILGLEGGNGPQ